MPKQTPEQKDIIEDVMSDFKEGDLETSAGKKVRKRNQAIAIALSEAGASKDNTPAENKKRLKKTRAKKKQ
ncbi:DUF6496 domain-containing protein [Asticcacaulis tiandongensis]|uniref:DUF6496 domain-containing protein n=1 Tax=Asticcacaulis tiandongensis TaxID=2565365 RepID=UPI00112839BA|nr:DUF6496 domain-containing protein [Asticcacaulis tiandongensis]